MSESRTEWRPRTISRIPSSTRRPAGRTGALVVGRRISSNSLQLSAYLLKHPAARNAYLLNKPPQLHAGTPTSMAACGSGRAWRRLKPPGAARTSRSMPAARTT